MHSLDPQVVMYRVNIYPITKSLKQAQRHFCPRIMGSIESEVKKLIDSGFIREKQYPDWIANTVPKTKKKEEIQICIDFQDLNKACPKDDFLCPLPVS